MLPGDEIRIIKRNVVLLGPQYLVGYVLDGKAISPRSPGADTLGELRAEVQSYLAAFDKPVIDLTVPNPEYKEF